MPSVLQLRQSAHAHAVVWIQVTLQSNGKHCWTAIHALAVCLGAVPNKNEMRSCISLASPNSALPRIFPGRQKRQLWYPWAPQAQRSWALPRSCPARRSVAHWSCAWSRTLPPVQCRRWCCAHPLTSCWMTWNVRSTMASTPTRSDPMLAGGLLKISLLCAAVSAAACRLSPV